MTDFKLEKNNHSHTCQNLNMAKSSGCNFYGFLHLDCHEFSLNKLSAKNISLRPLDLI